MLLEFDLPFASLRDDCLFVECQQNAIFHELTTGNPNVCHAVGNDERLAVGS